jgi:hypothetical protein
MYRKSILNSLCKDYLLSLNSRDRSFVIEQLKNFQDSNSTFTDSVFYKKFEDDFPFVGLTNQIVNRNNLSKIAKNTEIIKIIVVIYLVASLIGALYFLGN